MSPFRASRNRTKFFAAINVFFISMVTVIGPTPPGTGVMCPATFCTSAIAKQNKKKLDFVEKN